MQSVEVVEQILSHSSNQVAQVGSALALMVMAIKAQKGFDVAAFDASLKESAALFPEPEHQMLRALLEAVGGKYPVQSAQKI
jgi:hypothetical protein